MVLRAYIKKPDKNGLSRLCIVFNNKGKQWIATDIKVVPEAWDQVGQYIKPVQPHSKKLNAKIAEKKTEIANAIETLLKNKIDPTTLSVTEFIKPKRIEKVVVEKGISLSSLLTDYETKNTGRLKPGYLRKYGTIARSLDGHDPSLLAESFNIDELNRYISDYLLDQCDFENNTIHDYVRRIRFVMDRAHRKGLIKNTSFLEFGQKYIKPKPFWLDWSDVEKIEKFEPLKEHQVYKEDFLFRCYTGLRWSDAHQLRPEHFIKTKDHVYYDFHVIKTSLNQNIEMSPKAVAILKKWGFRIPKLYASDCNEKIKVIARGAKIIDEVEQVKFKGGDREVKLVPKWKLVTTHVARRSFARHWMDLNGDIAKLSKYLGHSSIGQTSDYVGYTTKEVNDELRKLMG
jgi:integrase